jgi:flavin-binding protein dodecin
LRFARLVGQSADEALSPLGRGSEECRAIAVCVPAEDDRTDQSCGERNMSDHIYKVIELAGSSEKSIEDAIQNAVGRASRTLKNLRWFEVVQTRGHLEDGKVHHYQVVLKVGFTLDDNPDD